MEQITELLGNLITIVEIGMWVMCAGVWAITGVLSIGFIISKMYKDKD